jgi:hypothetical protein
MLKMILKFAVQTVHKIIYNNAEGFWSNVFFIVSQPLFFDVEVIVFKSSSSIVFTI